jgi:hypothetical protein
MIREADPTVKLVCSCTLARKMEVVRPRLF